MQQLLIPTKDFSIAAYTRGDEGAEKLALLLPGKLDTGAYAHLISHAQTLAALGYFAVSFDPPGIWESSGTIRDYTTTSYLQTIHDLINHFGNRPTLLVGHSRGGSLAILAGTANSSVIAYCIIMSRYTLHRYGQTHYSTKKWKRMGFALSRRDPPPGSTQRTITFRLPYYFYEDQLQYDTTDALQICPKPKLFIAGKQDVIVLPESVIEGYNLSADPKMYREVDFGHAYRLHPDLIAQINIHLSEFVATLHE